MKKVSITALVLFFLAAGIYALIPGRTSQTEKYSGEELFAGILFMQGKVAAKIPAYKDIVAMQEELKHSSHAKRTTEINRIVNEIKQGDKDYFEKFKVNITSGNPAIIDKALAEAEKLIKSKTNNINGADEIANVNAGITLQVLDVDIVTSANAIMVAEASVFLLAQSNRLQKEIIVNQIASQFFI